MILVSLLFPSMLTYAVPNKTPKSSPPAKSKASPTTTKITIPSKPKLLLDTATVREYYLDGEFEPAIEMLETGLREKRPYKHIDSVFIFKHLGVMYAARYETRERGKYFMHQLLMTEPTARIMDMYASDMIYMIFKNIQEEYESTRGKLSRAEHHVRENSKIEANPPEPEKNPAGSSEKKGNALVWVGATTAVVAAGMAAYFIFEDEPRTIRRESSFE